MKSALFNACIHIDTTTPERDYILMTCSKSREKTTTEFENTEHINAINDNLSKISNCKNAAITFIF